MDPHSAAAQLVSDALGDDIDNNAGGWPWLRRHAEDDSAISPFIVVLGRRLPTAAAPS